MPESSEPQDLGAVAALIVDRAMHFAAQNDLRVCVVVLDASFTPLRLARSANAYRSTVPVATAKAHTALNFGAPTHVLRERVLPGNQLALSNVEPSLMFVGGGLPLLRDGRAVGAVGVSGGSEEQDVRCAEAALEGWST